MMTAIHGAECNMGNLFWVSHRIVKYKKHGKHSPILRGQDAITTLSLYACWNQM